MLGVLDGNPIKLDCDDHFKTINVINSLTNKMKRKKKLAKIDVEETYLSIIKAIY